MTKRQAEWLLAGVIIARSTSYLLIKNSLQELGTFTLLGIRFLLAFVFLLPVLWRRRSLLSRRNVLEGMALGAAFFLVMTAEVTGLRTTDTSTTSFLENTAIVFVPLFGAALNRKAPSRGAVYSALTALFGVGLLTLSGGGFHLTAGEGACLLAAVLYAGAILLTDRLSRRGDPLLLGVLQVGFMGVFATGAAFIFETPHLPVTGTGWGAVLYLAVVCTGFGFTLQPVAQSRTTADRAGLYCALNPACAAVLGRIFLHERLGVQGLLGAALVLGSILVAQLMSREEAAAELS